MENLMPESGPVAELSARLDMLEIAIATVLRRESPEKRNAFMKEFEQAIALSETPVRSTDDPVSWIHRLEPHVKRFKSRIR